MLEAAMTLGFDTITVKSEKEKDASGKETGKTVMVIRDARKRIDPLRLHKRTEGGIGADPSWVALVERLNLLLIAATATKLEATNAAQEKLDFQKLHNSVAMSEEARKLTLAGDKDPINDAIIQKDLTKVIEAMIGKGYTASPRMVAYLRAVHEKGGKESLNVVCTTPKSMRQYMLDVCHAAATGANFTLSYKEAKKG